MARLVSSNQWPLQPAPDRSEAYHFGRHGVHVAAELGNHLIALPLLLPLSLLSESRQSFAPADRVLAWRQRTASRASCNNGAARMLFVSTIEKKDERAWGVWQWRSAGCSTAF